MVKHVILDINGIKTWVSYLLPEAVEANAQVVVVVVPGNPGPIGFYDVFVSSLHEAAGGLISVYGVSHAGHHVLPSPCKLSDDWFDCFHNDDSYTYTLDEQVAHKLSFIQEYLPMNSKLILIGHSVGAYIIMEMMERLAHTDRLLKAIFLFPTMERITKTSKGWFWATLAGILRWPLMTIAYAFNLLPYRLRKRVIEFVAYMKDFTDSENIHISILSFLTCRGISNLLQISSDLKYIEGLERHSPMINKNLDKMTFYYGTDDPWVPLEYCNELKSEFPDIDIKVCAEQIPHAFVLFRACEMGQKVWDWIEGSIVNYLCIDDIVSDISKTMHVDFCRV